MTHTQIVAACYAAMMANNRGVLPQAKPGCDRVRIEMAEKPSKVSR